ncbi:MAG: acyl CoA:acetate/3-ketoacid CoA transferase [Agathobaculum sp.]|uniref:acyl CoA:acetate/3-ketoacid CoA transferase n=1 Tax=Agathobaculum sp. TaxID=2048138 RepID=UPI003D8FDD18
MKKVNIITAEEAALKVQDGDTIATGGFVSCACPETLSTALEKRFLETGHPNNLTLFFAAGQGHRDGTGGDHYGHEGMVKRVIGGHWDRAPRLGDLALANKIEAYNLPQGVISHMYRDIAAHNIGTITHVGLYTFADPRNGGGKLNDVTKEDLVKIVNIEGEERLLYKGFPINVVFLRASYCDEYGNCTVHREIGPLDVTAMAQACKNSGGKVIVQVEKIVQGGSLDPKLVAIPGIYVDSVVVGSEEDNMQCLGMPYDGALTGEFRIPVDAIPPIPMDAKKIIARRAAMELPPDAIVNLGTGAPEKIANVAAEEGISDRMTLTVEAGSIAGVPYGGTQFGAAANAMCIIPHNVQFDFYQGGGLDVAFLGLAETAPNGDLNVSKFGTRLAGAGGFIDITQNAKKVVYCGTFTAKGLKTDCVDGKLVITQEGSKKKFVNAVEHITFSGDYANKVKQPVLYITERCVFALRPEGVTLIEIAPGIDLQTQILDQMEFTPHIERQADGSIKLMDARIFRDELMGLAND